MSAEINTTHANYTQANGMGFLNLAVIAALTYASGTAAEFILNMSPGGAAFIVGMLGLALQGVNMWFTARRDTRVADLTRRLAEAEKK